MALFIKSCYFRFGIQVIVNEISRVLQENVCRAKKKLNIFEKLD